MQKKQPPPKQSKAELVEEVAGLLQNMPSTSYAHSYVLNFFTSLDLVMIRDELRGKKWPNSAVTK